MSPDSGTNVVNVGTRRSQLAIAQVDLIVEQLKAAAPGPNYRARVVNTMADENQVKSFQDFNSKSIWTEESERLSVDKELDVIVHCSKDMPTLSPESCMLGVVCEREDPRDVVVMRAVSLYTTIQDLPAGSVVGTSSVRRKAQILRQFPHLVCSDIRGNSNTRLRKSDADDSPFACLALAAAGLKRINLTHRISQYLGASDGMLYAPGQGALGMEIRKGDSKTLQLLSPLSHGPTTSACLAERSLSRALEGGCSAPIGVWTDWKDSMLVMSSAVLSVDGKQIVESSVQGRVDDQDRAETLGRELAERMIELGASKILQELESGWKPS